MPRRPRGDAGPMPRRPQAHKATRAAPPEWDRPCDEALLRDAELEGRTQKSMSPPPGIPPPPPAGVFSGLSATTASVVRNSAAMEAAFCSADRVTLAGSMIPAL